MSQKSKGDTATAMESMRKMGNKKPWRCYIEAWEVPPWKEEKLDAQYKLLAKYQGVRFTDPDSNLLMTASSDSLVWVTQHKQWGIEGQKPTFDPKNIRPDDWEAYMPNANFFGMVHDYILEHHEDQVLPETLPGCVGEDGKWCRWTEESLEG